MGRRPATTLDGRPHFFNADGTFPTPEWERAYAFEYINPDDPSLRHYYCPTPKGEDFHEAIEPNVIIEGSRGTGKSLIIRNDAHQRALSYPGYTYLIVRRTMPELKKSHLHFIAREMKIFGGFFHKTDYIAHYPNGSIGWFSHCEREDDVLRLLSAEFCAIYFDEISTFTWEMVTKIAACARVPEGSGLQAIIRGGTNPIGVGADEVNRYFIAKTVEADEDSEYNPADYRAIHTTLADNPYIDRKQYIKRLSMLPWHVRRAWLDGEWIVEGAYFNDFRPIKDGKQWHVVSTLPKIGDKWLPECTWITYYRALDWGFSPDPAVCLWIAVLPSGRALVVKEKHWYETAASDVAKDIIAESTGMKCAETFCDPTLFVNQEESDFNSLGDIIESNGVPLTKSVNDRIRCGYAIHEWLNTTLADGLPKLQCFNQARDTQWLVKTIPQMRIDKNNAKKIADHKQDHWVICLGYFCMGRTGKSFEPKNTQQKRWMKPKHKARTVTLGRESVRKQGARRFGGV